MLFLAVTGFILINALGIIFLPRSTACIYIWYTISQWNYLAKGAPDWMLLPGVLLVISTVVTFVWDIVRGSNFLGDSKQRLF